MSHGIEPPFARTGKARDAAATLRAEQAFWEGLSGIIQRFDLRNEELLERRSSVQRRIDEWHHRVACLQLLQRRSSMQSRPVDVAHAQQAARHLPREDLLARILSPPVMPAAEVPSPEEVQQELEENCQSILGYVVRWEEQGVGCSKVPDLRGVRLMEDRATLRVSSQLLASWLRRGVINDEQLDAAMRKMARVVDSQNASDAAYEPMGPALEQSKAFQTACQLVREGGELANCLTEPVLHAFRRKAKAARTQRSRL